MGPSPRRRVSNEDTMISACYKSTPVKLPVVAAFALLTSVTVAGCADQASGGESRTLAGSAESPSALASRVLGALSAGDTALLSSVRLTEREHDELVWPELPAASPEVNYPVDLAWQNIQTRNHAAVASLTRAYEGHELGLEYVECRGGTQEFQTFVVLTDCYVGFRDGRDTVVERQLFKDILRMNGEHKIFRFYK